MEKATTTVERKTATPIAIAVVEHDDRFLIGRRPPGVTLAGFWEFPGGKVEIGETAAECAARECLEEAGVAIEVQDLYSECTHLYEHGLLDLHFFRCRPMDAAHEPRPPFCWVERVELRGFQFPPANLELLKLLTAVRPDN
jgi:8-oxo-dGTP diphosphatase